MTGPQWAGIYGKGQDEEAIAALHGDFPGIPSLSVRQLIVDAKNALESNKMATEHDFLTRITRAKSESRSPDRSDQEKVKYKIETAPKLLQPANKLMYNAHELTTLFSKLLLWVGPKSSELAAAFGAIQVEKLSVPHDISEIIGTFRKEQSRIIDQELAAELVVHLPKCLEAEIIKVKGNHMVCGRASSLRILQALKQRVEKKTKSRGSTLLVNMINRRPCGAKHELQKELQDLEGEYLQLERMGCTPGEKDTILHPALVGLMKTLEDDAQCGATVLARMAAVEQACPGDSEALWDILWKLA